MTFQKLGLKNRALAQCFGIFLTLGLIGCSENSAPSVTNDAYLASELNTKNISYDPTAPNYTVNAYYDEIDHTISGSLTVSFTNNLGKAMDKMRFNVWANAPIFGSSVTIKNIRVNGKPVKASLQNTVLTIHDIAINDGETATVHFTFNINIPKQKDRFGWSDRQVSLGNWLPIVAVYDNHGWNTPPYIDFGESFYSVTGSFDVTITAPADLEVLATGKQISKSKLGNRQTIHFLAPNVRDFFVLLNTPFKKLTAKTGDVSVTIAYRQGEEDAAAKMLKTAKQVLPKFEAWFGNYPWQSLTIASADYSSNFDGGMEYPTLVTMNTPHLTDDEELSVTVAHEIAHQWFYSLVGSNAYREPWLDEALTTFASYAAFYDTTDFDWIKDSNSGFSITTSIDEFTKNEDDYGQVIYDDGAKMLSQLHDHVGDKIFWQALRRYVDENRFGIATTADFIRIFQQESKQNLKPFFERQGVILDETQK